MATLKDFMGDLKRGDGRKFKSEYYSAHQWFEPIYKTDVGTWYGLCENGSNFFSGEDHCENWEPYTEPKTKKKVTLYRPITKEGENYLLYDRYCNNKDLFYGHVVGWQEIEVEVDE